MKIFINSIFILLAFSSFNNLYSQNTLWENISDKIPGDSLNNLSDVFWGGTHVAWIASDSLPELYMTWDAGETWEIKQTPSPISAFRFNEMNSDGIACGIDGSIYKTTNNGDDWILIGSTGYPINDFSIAYQYFDWEGYICGDSGKVWILNESGLSEINSNLIVNFSSVSARTIDHVWFCGDSSIYFYDGNTFNQKYTAPVQLNAIQHKYPSYIWAVGALGLIAFSSDSGQSWTEQINPDPLKNSLNDVWFVPFFNWGYGWTVGDSGIILRTTNFGNTWSIEGEGIINQNLQIVHFNASQDYWGGYFGPGIILGEYKTVLFNYLIVSVENESSKINDFQLYQNYPNPFNPTTTIKYQIPELSFITLKIYDVLGTEIAVLVNEEKPAGSYEINCNANSLSSGIYFYQLSATGGAGKFTKARKMILLR